MWAPPCRSWRLGMAVAARHACATHVSSITWTGRRQLTWSQEDENKFARALEDEKLKKVRTEMEEQGVLAEARKAAENRPIASTSVDLSPSIAAALARARDRLQPPPSQAQAYKDLQLARFKDLREGAEAATSDEGGGQRSLFELQSDADGVIRVVPKQKAVATKRIEKVCRISEVPTYHAIVYCTHGSDSIQT